MNPPTALTPPVAAPRVGPATGRRRITGERPHASGTRLAGSRARAPRVMSGALPRPRLLRGLLGSGAESTVLITAPAGYGKTTLLVQWSERDERPFAWLALEPADRDPARLVGRLLLALDEVEPLGAEDLETARSLAAGAAGDSGQGLARLTRLVAQMGDGRRPAVLVVEDLHNLRGRRAPAVVEALASAFSAEGRLALSARTRPPLALGRLRVQRGTLEIGPRELAFSAAEASEALAAYGLPPESPDVGDLLAITEGWPAGLRLAALSLREDRGPGDRGGFAAGREAVRRYVLEEILRPMPPAARGFLMRAAVLEQLSPQLCDAVLERADSAARLRSLQARNTMVESVESSGPRLRCHPLVRGALRAELESRHPEELPGLHRRAASWLAAHGEYEGAAAHMLAAGDLEEAGELIWRRLAPRSQDGEGERLERLLGGLAEERIAEHPALALSAAHRHLAAARLGRAERLAAAAAAAMGERRSPDMSAGLALIEAAVGAGGIGRMNERARRAERLLGGSGPWACQSCLLRGVHAHLSGDAASARGLLEEALHRSPGTMPQTETLALAQLALIEAEAGDWERAQDRLLQARARIEEHDLETDPACALALAVAAWVASSEGEIDEAKRLVPRAARLLVRLEDYMPWHMVETRVVLARAAIRLGEIVRARQLLSQASRTARSIGDCPLFHAWLDGAWGLIDELSAVALSGPSSLTMAELRILRFLPTHLSFREIGERLHVSTNTVKSQAHAIYGKLGTSSRSEAVARASRLGLINAAVV